MSDADDLPPPPSALQYVAAFVSAWLWRSLLPGAVLMPIASWVERWFFWQPPVNTVAASVAYYARPYLVAGVACAVVGLVLVCSTASGFHPSLNSRRSHSTGFPASNSLMLMGSGIALFWR